MKQEPESSCTRRWTTSTLPCEVSARRIRLVLHLDVDRAAVDRAAAVLAELLDR